MKIRAYAIIALSAAIASFSCGNPLNRNTEGVKGSLIISEAGASRAASRNLYQWPEAVVTLQADGVWSLGQTFSRSWASGSSVTIDSLDTGAWSIAIRGLDAGGAAIRQGSATTTISSNTTNTISVTLGYMPGTGSVSFSISWPAGADIASGNGVFDKGQTSELPIVLIIAGNAASASLPSVTAGEGHTFELSLKNSSVANAYATNGTIHVTNGKNTPVIIDLSASSINCPPPAPEGLAAQNGIFCVDLNWSESTGADGYFIDRRLAGGIWSALTAAPIPAGTATYRDKSAVEQTGYEYRVSAYNSLGESASSPIAFTTARFSDAIVRSPVAFGAQNAFRLLEAGTVTAYGSARDNQLGRPTKEISATGVSISGLSRIVSVKTNISFYCSCLALDEDGVLWQWGYLDGTSSTSLHRVIGISRAIIDMCAGDGFWLALDADGNVWAWGDNYYGELGNGGIADNYVPSIVLGLPPIASIAAGSDNAIVAALDGRIFSWGNNSSGQLGLGDTTQRNSPVEATGISTAIRVRAGSRKSFVILSNGSVMAAGYGATGAFGLPTGTYSSFTEIPSLSSIVDIASMYSCSIALDTGGALYASGDNSRGVLLSAWPFSGTTSFGPMVGTPSGITGIVGACDKMFCTTGIGEKYSWGENLYGELMIGKGSVHPTAAQVSTPATFTQVKGDNSHFTAIDADGDVWTWGNNAYGQLGDGTTTTRPTPVEVLDAASPAIQIDARYNQVIVLLADGSIYTWGNGFSSSTPQLSTDPNLGSGVIQVAKGSSHELALKSDGTVWAWGNNSYGQIGDGTTANKSVATQVKGIGGVGFLTNVMWIGCSKNTSAAMLSDGTILVWGSGSDGMIGNGGTANALTPINGSGLMGVSKVAIGGKTIIAYKDSVNWMWGSMYGVQRTAPINYDLYYSPGINPYLDLSINNGFYPTAVAVLADGTVRAGGENEFGQMGDGTVEQDHLWSAVAGPTGIVAVAASDNVSAALSSTGQLWTWGSNAYGELGNGTIDPEGIGQPQLLSW